MYPGQAFGGGKRWRRRYARRFNIGVRRKTNVKNKTWADTEPVLMRYLTGLRKRLQFEEDPMHEEEDGVEPEPEDEDPEVEEEERVGDVDPLDSASDDSDVDNNETTVELTTFDEAMPDGMCAAPVPSESQLEFKNAAGKELKDMCILYNWDKLGWWVGRIKRANGDN